MELLEDVDRFLDAVVKPLEVEHAELLTDLRRRYRPEGTISAQVLELKRRVRTQAAAAGLYGLMVPAELGGPGLSTADQYAVWRHLYSRCGPDRLLPYDAVGTFTSGPGAALAGLTPEARARIWAPVLAGEEILCFALSERTGSDQAHVQTTASPAGDGFVLRGQKTWVSRGGYADHALVYAVVPGTEPEPEPEPSRPAAPTSAFLVPLSTPGVTVAEVNLLLGRVGGEEVTLAFEDVAVQGWQLVGDIGRGGAVAAAGAAASTIFTAGRFVGLARWALHHAAERAGPAAGVADREARRLTAEAASDVEAVDLFAREYSARADAGQPAEQLQALIRRDAAAMCGRVYERVMQIEGADALTNRAGLFDGWHQSRIVQVAQAGLTDVLNDTIASRVSTNPDDRAR
jgi:acyl-CoA dehydrogenase